ncbi:MAG: alpha/beta fold hydrolase [Myxococcaceae bacterium]
MRHGVVANSAAILLLAASVRTFAQSESNTAARSGFAPIDGLEMYYEVHGAGEPLILLHGGLGSTDMFTDILPALAKNRQVITVDLQAHGRTADITRSMSYEAMADDVAGLIQYLGLRHADVMGYSMGGEVALRIAIQHPDEIRKLVIVSAAFRRDGWYPEIVAQMIQMSAAASETFKQTPMYQNYSRVAPRREDWPVLSAKLGELFRKDYDWSKDVQKIKVPVMLVFGDADAVRTAHAVQLFELLGGGRKDGGWDGSGMSSTRLAILPGMTHYKIASSSELVSAVIPFLDSPMPVRK